MSEPAPTTVPPVTVEADTLMADAGAPAAPVDEFALKSKAMRQGTKFKLLYSYVEVVADMQVSSGVLPFQRQLALR